ncbi:uncharacterized protein LOC143529564 [Bidens hawaiensis]|uniref:uncharacterized protein LOC143529564 n=1 Tax=Bidens hawaiensis TaxID=980011 RepID=UPI00404A5D77
MGRIPTWEALKQRNIRIMDSVCVIREIGIESVDHITTGCLVAAVVWEHVSRWCKIPPIFGFSVRDLLELYKTIEIGETKKEALHGIVIMACWRIRKAGNEKVFNSKVVNLEEIIGDIKSLGFLWFKNKSKNRSIEWMNWCRFDFM